MSVDTQGEAWVAVTQVLRQLLDGDATGKHDAGVVVAKLVDAFLTGGDVAVPPAAVFNGLRLAFTRAGFQTVSE
jgi:hypothetical protein